MAKAIIDTLKATDSSKEKVIVYPRTLVEAIRNEDGINLEETLNNKINIPLDSDGNINHGTEGQFAVSNGTGGIKWVTIVDGDGVDW